MSKPDQMLNVVNCFLPDNSQSKMNLETKTAVKMLATRPMTSVRAKPLTAVEPKANKKAQETTVVTWVSIIVKNALPNPASTDAKTVVEGVDMVEKKLHKTLAGHGMEIINPVDHPFDPSLHEAVMTEPAASKDEDHLVARVFQVGYLFNGQLLRPARVVVRVR